MSKRTKKDPGVPSSAPFKEEVLREAEQRRLQVGMICMLVLYDNLSRLVHCPNLVIVSFQSIMDI